MPHVWSRQEDTDLWLAATLAGMRAGDEDATREAATELADVAGSDLRGVDAAHMTALAQTTSDKMKNSVLNVRQQHRCPAHTRTHTCTRVLFMLLPCVGPSHRRCRALLLAWWQQRARMTFIMGMFRFRRRFKRNKAAVGSCSASTRTHACPRFTAFALPSIVCVSVLV